MSTPSTLGANTSGKSTLLRAVCLAAVCAQVGCYVPAAAARLAPADGIFTRMGAEDRCVSNPEALAAGFAALLGLQKLLDTTLQASISTHHSMQQALVHNTQTVHSAPSLSILLGQSTFAVEMAEASVAVALATPSSLLVMDELGQ